MGQTETLRFEKIVNGVAVYCKVSQDPDGSVEISGDEIDTWIFEFCDDAMERAVRKVEEEGYVRTAELGGLERVVVLENSKAIISLWKAGKSLDAGRLAFETLDACDRPTWASNILKLVVDHSGTRSKAIGALLELFKDRSQWSMAKPIFSNLRSSLLSLEGKSTRTAKQELELCTLYLAENVAKVIYNSTDPPDKFDDDSGWWVASCLRHCLDLLDDELLEQRAVRQLCFCAS